MTTDIHDLIGALEAAWNRKDADAFAACFDERAEFGHVMVGGGCGRETIRESHAALFAGIYAVSVITYRIVSVRPLGDWTAAVELEQTLDFEIDGQLLSARGAPKLIARRDGDAWRISMFSNRRLESGPVPVREAARHAA